MPVSIQPISLLLAMGAIASGALVACLDSGSDAGAAGQSSMPGPTSVAGAGTAGGGSSALGSAGVAGSVAISSGGLSTGGGTAAAGVAGASGASLAGGGGVAAGGTGGATGAGGSGGAQEPAVHPRGSTFCDEKPLNLGDMHLLTNEWTDPEADTCVFLDMAGNFGWKWTRGATGMQPNPNYPNYPEAEFGINPWNTKGIDKSTTTLLPKQLKDITSASMTVDVFTDVGSNNTGWNLAFELWLADKDPTLGPASPKGEIMVFLSNAPDYYPQNAETQQSLNDGIHDYKLYVSSDNWGTWGYYRQYRLDTHDGRYTGKLNIGAFLKHYAEDEHWDTNLWVTRFELGNEVYQNTSGTTTIKSLSFEVNGQTQVARTE